MNRILCIHLPNWSVQRVVVDRPELKGQPVVLFAHLHPRGQRVVACSDEAGLHGIRVGMPLAEAKVMLEQAEVRAERLEVRGQGAGVRGQELGVRSQESGGRSQESGGRGQESGVRSQELGVRSQGADRSQPASRISHPGSRIASPNHQTTRHQTPDTLLFEHDPVADRETLVQLARWSERFSPLLGLEDTSEPTDLLLDITGLSPLFGSETQLAHLIAKSFQSRGYHVRIAIADTIGAAWAMAHYGQMRNTEGRARNAELGARSAECDKAEPFRAPRSALRASPPFRIPHSDFRIHDAFRLPVGHGLSPLHNLPVSALRLPDETVALLAELGIERIGQLVALPRASLSSRFGDGLALRIDQAEGLVDEVIVAERPVEGFGTEWTLEYPTHNRKAIETIVARLIEQIARRLADEDQGVVQLECRLVCGKQPLRISVGLFEPTATAAHLVQLVRMQLDRLKLPQPVGAVHVQATVTARLEQKQNELFAGDSRQCPRQLTALVDRLSSRLGRHAVVRPRSLDDPQPERSWRYVPLTGQSRPRRPKMVTATRRTKTNKSAATAGNRPALSGRQKELKAADRPLRLYRPALSLDVVAVVPDGPPIRFTLQNQQHVIARHWGPERIETGWWRGASVRRDYYRVETNTGHRFWLFRHLDDGKWFLHGEFE